MSEVAEPSTQPAGSALAPWLVAVLAPLAALVLVAVLVVVVGGRDARPAHDMPGVGLAAAPLDLASVTSDVATHYEYAVGHQVAYRDIPCFCGCNEFLDHRSLYDCFVRSDGQGWDAHAAGCGVCIGESTVARQLLDRGDDLRAVRAAVIAQFGTTPTTAPAQT